jgi:hypothetical protein
MKDYVTVLTTLTSLHTYAGLVDTPEGARFLCRWCGPITAEQWAADCPGMAQVEVRWEGR